MARTPDWLVACQSAGQEEDLEPWIRGGEDGGEALVVRMHTQAELPPPSTAFLLLEDVGAGAEAARAAARAATKSRLTSTADVHNGSSDCLFC
jgi:hypothetical protein